MHQYAPICQINQKSYIHSPSQEIFFKNLKNPQKLALLPIIKIHSFIPTSSVTQAPKSFLASLGYSIFTPYRGMEVNQGVLQKEFLGGGVKNS